MAVQAVLFDIDGTLISTGGAGAESWRRAFLDLYDVPADIGEFSDAGMTDPEVARLTFSNVVGHEPSASELEQVMARRQHHLPDAVAESEGYRVLDGVPAVLERLLERGVLLGLTTGGTEDAAQVKLARADLNRFFAFGGYGSDSPDRTELTRCGVQRARAASEQELDGAEIAVVGDTPHDIEAAHNAGVVAIGVATGHFDAAKLREAGAEHVLDSLAEDFPV